MRKNKKLAFVVASIFLATLWGCGSNMDSGGDQTGSGTIADPTSVGSDSCKACHAFAHAKITSPLIGALSATEKALDIRHECELCHGGGQYHYGTGPIPVPKPNQNTCTACHSSTVAQVLVTPHVDGGVVNCAGCHKSIATSNRSTSCMDCHTTLTADQIKLSPFSNQIYERFTAGRHTGNHRANACSACHSHQGALLMLSQAEKISTKAQIAALVEELTLLGVPNVPTGQTANPVYLKQCATCHDPHTATLRGVGDIKDTFTLQSGTAWERTVYSAEFNLCTSCHQVNLETTWDPTGGYSNAGVIKYELSDVYTKSDTNPDPYTNTGIGYHTDSYQRRSFVDTHFSGELYKKLYYYDVKDGVDAARKDRNGNYVVNDPADIALLQAMYDEYLAAPDNIEIAGFNVNPGSANACSACHDVHGANKLVVPFASTLNGEKNFEANIATAIAYGEGIGATHGNYMGNAFARNVSSTDGNMYASANCTPCHVGRDYVKMTVGATKADIGAAAWNPVSCVSCHDTAQNAAPLTNPRSMPDGYVFSFPSTGSISPTAAELGSSQICFECHRGRTPAGVDVSALPDGPTNHYDISYLHYSPTFATYYGNDAKMVATYAGKTYRGKSTTHSADSTRDIGGGLTHGVDGGALCLDCHDVHRGIRVSNPNIRNGRECATCHDSDATAWHNAGRIGPMPEGNKFDQRSSKGDVSATAARLIDTIYAQMMATNNTGFNANLTTFLTNLHAQTDVDQGKEMVKLRIKERTLAGGWPTKEIAHACASWKVFYYEDKASFAHNRNFARQVMFDAIESLGGDTVGIPTRPL